MGPCAASVGLPGHFSSATNSPHATDLEAARQAKACNDDAWPDGEGSFHTSNASAWYPEEVAAAFDVLDWSEGVVFKQLRVEPTSGVDCATKLYSGVCLPELGVGASQPGREANAPFGHNWTHPDSPLSHPWRYFTAQELGANPSGIASAAVPSFRTFSTGGYVALVLPFLSTTLLPEQRGTPSEVIDFRKHLLPRSSESLPRPAQLYVCVRLCWNGEHLHQICDPNDGSSGRTTGVVRLAVEVFFNDLKRGHFVDAQTRALSITMPLRSNHLGIRSRVTLMLETTAMGAVLPSYDIETRVESDSKMRQTQLWVKIALGMCVFFVALEGIELVNTGPVEYLTDPWNFMDAVNFGIFFLTYFTLRRAFELEASPQCESELCEHVGYRDDWELMVTIRSAKLYLSLCVCVQLLKIIKFMKVLLRDPIRRLGRPHAPRPHMPGSSRHGVPNPGAHPQDGARDGGAVQGRDGSLLLRARLRDYDALFLDDVLRAAWPRDGGLL